MPGIVETFQTFSGILVVCPCCENILRVSDLNLKYTGKFERTVLDLLRAKERTLENKENRFYRRLDRFSAKEGQLKEESRERGRRKARTLIRKLDPSWSKLRYDPKDIKVISYPVDLVVFDGLNSGGRIKNVVFVAREKIQGIKRIRNSIGKALKDGRFLWETVRVREDGAVEVSNN